MNFRIWEELRMILIEKAQIQQAVIHKKEVVFVWKDGFGGRFSFLHSSDPDHEWISLNFSASLSIEHKKETVRMKRKNILAILIFGLLMISSWQAFAQSEIKVATVGNSITEGSGLTKTYPQALQELLGEEYEVRNFGVSGRTLLKKGDYPYWNEEKYQEVLSWNPDIVVIKLGTNDTKPQNWVHKKDFVKDYRKLIKSFKKLPSNPQVFISLPMPAFEEKWGINEEIIKNEVLPAVKKIARKEKVEIIDLYTPFVGRSELTYDNIHPNEEGAAYLAQQVYEALKASERVEVK